MRPRYILLAAILAASAGLAHAGDAANGATLFRKCLACHTATEARNKVGPNLVGVIDRPVASVAGFRYSKAMRAYSAGKTWTEADLATFLASPQGLVKGTSMAFYGFRSPEDVADVIAYLRDPAAVQ